MSSDKEEPNPKNNFADGAETDDSKFIKHQVVDSEENGQRFRMKITSHLLKLKQSYSSFVGKSVFGMRFLFDGKRIDDDDTPEQLGLIDLDVIEVYYEQIGGWSPIKDFCVKKRN